MASTVEASEEFKVSATIQQCWDFFEDLSKIGSCIPGCESVSRNDDQSANFKVKLKVGYISRTFDLKARLKDIIRPNHLSFIGEGNDAQIFGTLDLSPIEAGSVSVRYKLQIKAISVTGKTAMGMIGKELVRRQTSEFASCVKSKLQG